MRTQKTRRICFRYPGGFGQTSPVTTITDQNLDLATVVLDFPNGSVSAATVVPAPCGR
jgi:hypothetical protein